MEGLEELEEEQYSNNTSEINETKYFSDAFHSVKNKPFYELFSQTFKISKKKLNYYSPLNEQLSPFRSNKIKRKINMIQREIESIDFRKNRTDRPAFSPGREVEEDKTEKDSSIEEEETCTNAYTPMTKFKPPINHTKFNITLFDNLRTDEHNFVEFTRSELINTRSLLDSPSKPVDKHRKKLQIFKNEFEKDVRRSSNKPVINLNIATMNMETDRLSITSNRISKNSTSQSSWNLLK